MPAKFTAAVCKGFRSAVIEGVLARDLNRVAPGSAAMNFKHSLAPALSAQNSSAKSRWALRLSTETELLALKSHGALSDARKRVLQQVRASGSNGLGKALRMPRAGAAAYSPPELTRAPVVGAVPGRVRFPARRGGCAEYGSWHASLHITCRIAEDEDAHRLTGTPCPVAHSWHNESST